MQFKAIYFLKNLCYNIYRCFLLDFGDDFVNRELFDQARLAATELCVKANLKPGDIMVIGCSSSEVAGGVIGHDSSLETAEAVFKGIYEALTDCGVYLAAQCCEHLNRAIIVERDAVPNAEIVNVVPQPKAGGSFATTAYNTFKNPVALEEIKADAGLDIGGTLIGMHIHPVVVPLRISMKKIGEAAIICARRRPKFVGGCRAVYNEELM